ncbi:hypothetical protein BH24ACT13_BH24ACT13_10120 [soil metagenome]
MPTHALLAGLLILLPGAPVPASSAAAPPLVGSSVAAERASRWQWPLAGTPEVLRYFAPPPVRWAAGHRGVDLAAAPAERVRAAGSGVVGYAGRLAGRGVVTVIHGGLRTTYEPVTAVVVAGQRVLAGDVIGRLEPATGHCPGRSCLHWGLLRGDVYLDPLLLVRRGPSRLLPIFGGPRSVSSTLPQAEPPAGSRAGPGSGSQAGPPTGLRTAAVAASLASSVLTAPLGALLLAAPANQRPPGPRGPPDARSAGRPSASRSYSSGAL